jgi:hypothetical protein
MDLHAALEVCGAKDRALVKNYRLLRAPCSMREPDVSRANGK